MSFVTPTSLWKTGAGLIVGGMINGAFGAHAIKSRKDITPSQIEAWRSASYYALFNGLGLLVLSLHPRFSVHKCAGPLITVGAVLFSGTIWLLALSGDRFRFLGPVTPLGGTVLIAGYISLLF